MAGDRGFLVLSAPAEEGSYNYADDEALCQFIREGARGAYWDIISQSREVSKGTKPFWQKKEDTKIDNRESRNQP